MFTHFVIERWREALLWSWVVGKHGGLDDSWTKAIQERAWSELGGRPRDKVTKVRAKLRETMSPARVEENLRESGHVEVDNTKYEFCEFLIPDTPVYATYPFYFLASQDGYPYATFQDDARNTWALYHGVDDKLLPRCAINYDVCFTDSGRLFENASDVFKNIAFKQKQCGDCSMIPSFRSLMYADSVYSHYRPRSSERRRRTRSIPSFI